MKNMKWIKIVLFFLPAVVSFYNANGQVVDSIKVKAEYGSRIKDVQMLMDLDHIDYYKVSFSDKIFKNSPYLLLTTKEYLKGVLTKKDTLLSAEFAKKYLKFEKIDSTTLLTLITRPKGDSITFYYNLLGVQFSKTYKRIIRDDYSLRDGLVTNELYKNVATNTVMPLFVYSLPYEDPKQPGYKYYCALTANGVSPEKWWDIYKVEHYIIVEINIVNI